MVRLLRALSPPLEAWARLTSARSARMRAAASEEVIRLGHPRLAAHVLDDSEAFVRRRYFSAAALVVPDRDPDLWASLLSRALAGPDGSLQQAAAFWLRGDPAAVRAVTLRFDSGNAAERAQALATLAALGDPALAKKLSRGLLDPRPTVRAQALRLAALAEVWPTSTEMQGHLLDPSPKVAVAALHLWKAHPGPKPALEPTLQESAGTGPSRSSVRLALALPSPSGIVWCLRAIADRWPGHDAAVTQLAGWASRRVTDGWLRPNATDAALIRTAVLADESRLPSDLVRLMLLVL